MDEITYDIQELVDLSGVSRRNIYFYVQQGVLPAPQGAGLAARYGEEHLLRLRLIPVFRRDGLRLDQIRQKFETVNPATLRRLLAEKAPEMPPAPSLPSDKKLHLPERLEEVHSMPRPGGSQAELCQRFDLPGGMILIVPQSISMNDSLRLERILEAVGLPLPDPNGKK